ncbi:MAG: carbon storage regulator [Planctomycetota bacterium]
MLVLSRKVGEKIVIGDNITITLVRMAGNRVSIGVEAPDQVRVIRGEILPEACSEVRPELRPELRPERHSSFASNPTPETNSLTVN